MLPTRLCHSESVQRERKDWCVYIRIRGYGHVINTTASCGHRWRLWGWHDDRYGLRAEWRQGLHRISEREAAQGGAFDPFVVVARSNSDLL